MRIKTDRLNHQSYTGELYRILYQKYPVFRKTHEQYHFRGDELVALRYAFFYVAANLFPSDSYALIGSFFRKDHTMVIHAKKAHRSFYRVHDNIKHCLYTYLVDTWLDDIDVNILKDAYDEEKEKADAGGYKVTYDAKVNDFLP